MPSLTEPLLRNFVPLPYRQVSVQPYNGALTETAILSHLLNREAYRRTRFIILHGAGGCAIAQVERAEEAPLFSPITAARVIALPPHCHWVEDATIDTANPSALAAKARTLNLTPDATLVVRGLDSHVNFIHQPAPISIRVVDVVPPASTKLVRMAQQVLGYAELPAIELLPDLIDLYVLAHEAPAEAYLVPCRAAGLELNVPTFFLDERPERREWTMLACERSCQIHRHFYGEADAPRVDFCPRNRVQADDRLTLTKCCMLEFDIEVKDRLVIVPWGASLKHVEAALQALTQAVPINATEAGDGC
ncbi:MAG: DUF7714 family protein [Anaerolineales bacterium]